ncbi:MAG: hypothetical protein KU37_05785 [Sulfuricurvum sp. PC08-66]|nr:MAG: hypothetical protein KU37_05785 [Sulfuricurvum sp. PC08-66]
MLERDEAQDESWSQKYLGLKLSTLLWVGALVAGSGIYIGILLFGANSVDAYIQLQTYQAQLANNVAKLKQENAQLQKEYFELKEITVGH